MGAAADVAVARAALFPTIRLSTSIGSRELDKLFGSGNNTWSFVPQIRWPIFDGGGARAAVNVAQAFELSEARFTAGVDNYLAPAS